MMQLMRASRASAAEIFLFQRDRFFALLRVRLSRASALSAAAVARIRAQGHVRQRTIGVIARVAVVGS